MREELHRTSGQFLSQLEMDMIESDKNSIKSRLEKVETVGLSIEEKLVKDLL